MDSLASMKENTQKGPKWKRSRYVELYFQQHHPFHTVTKVLQDPQNRLSRKQRKEIYENSDLNFSCDYSIDKNRRWEAMKPETLRDLTEMQKHSGIDFYVTENYSSRQTDNVNKIHLIRSPDEVISVENTGRMTSMASMIFQVSGTPKWCLWRKKSEKEKWKDAVIRPRIMYNVSKMHPCKGLFYRMFRTGRSYWWDRELHDDKGELALFLYYQSRGCHCEAEYDDEHWIEYLEDEADALHLEVDEDAREFLSQSRKSKTLNDFIIHKKKRTRTRSLALTQGTSTSEWELLENGEEMNDGANEGKDKPATSNMKISNSVQLINRYSKEFDEPNLEKAFSNQCGYFGSFDITYSGDLKGFTDEINSFSNEITVKWVDEQRVFCDLTPLLKRPSEDVNRPQLVVALHLSLPTIKITINTLYKEDRMLDMLLRYSFRKDTKEILGAILAHILRVVYGWKEKRYVEPKMDSRCTRQPHLFSSAANSALRGVLAVAPTQAEIISAIREEESYWSQEILDQKMEFCEKAEKCSLCEMDLNNDSFSTAYGKLCSNCVRLVLYSQMISCRPITIFSDKYSAVDLLPFFVPLRQIELYYNKVAREVLDVGQWMTCPRCEKSIFLPLTLENSNETDLDIAICAECSTHFCTLCLSEPHFPMNCAEHFDWNLIFDDYYAVMTRNTQHVWRISCICGVLIEVEEGEETAQCSGCGQAFSPRHIQLQGAHKPLVVKDIRYHEVQKLYTFDGGAYKVKVLQKKKVALNGRFAKPAMASRRWRLDQKAQKDLVDGLKKPFIPHSTALAIKETCKLAHMIIENGYGLLYLYRYENHREEWAILCKLNNLLWNFLSSREMNLLEPLEKCLQSTVKLFSKFEHNL